MDVSSTCESETVALCDTPQMKTMTQSDQLIVARTLLADWREGQFKKQGDGRNCEMEWSEEEDNDVSEMSLDNRLLRKSFLNTHDHNNPFHFSTVVKTSENETKEEKRAKSVSLAIQGKYILECSEEEDSDWSEEDVSEMSAENKDLWDFFLNNSNAFNLLHVSCSTKIKTSDQTDDDEEEEAVFLGSPKNNTVRIAEAETAWSTERLLEAEDLCDEPLRNTACEVGRNTEKPAKKVRFRKQVTIHTLQAWGVDSQAARDGSCWMEMARDRNRFKRRVNQAEEIISTCLTAQHRARVIARLLKRSQRSSLVTDCRKKLFYFILAAIILKICLCTAVVFTSVH